MDKQDRIDMLEGRLKRLKRDGENYTHALSRYPGYLMGCIEKDKDYPLDREELSQFVKDYKEMLDNLVVTVELYWRTERELQEAKG